MNHSQHMMSMQEQVLLRPLAGMEPALQGVTRCMAFKLEMQLSQLCPQIYRQVCASCHSVHCAVTLTAEYVGIGPKVITSSLIPTIHTVCM